MNWQEVSEMMKNAGAFIFKKQNRGRTLWIGGSASLLTVFTFLLLLTGVSETHSGDIYCGNVCESYINITSTYWRICFEENFSLIYTEPSGIETYVYVPSYGNNWREFNPKKDCIERGKVNRFKVIGIKPKELTVKWWSPSLKVPDPLWIGTGDELNNETITFAANETKVRYYYAPYKVNATNLTLKIDISSNYTEIQYELYVRPSDNFEDNSINSSIWFNASSTIASTVTEEGGLMKFEITPISEASGILIYKFNSSNFSIFINYSYASEPAVNKYIGFLNVSNLSSHTISPVNEYPKYVQCYKRQLNTGVFLSNAPLEIRYNDSGMYYNSNNTGFTNSGVICSVTNRSNAYAIYPFIMLYSEGSAGDDNLLRLENSGFLPFEFHNISFNVSFNNSVILNITSVNDTSSIVSPSLTELNAINNNNCVCSGCVLANISGVSYCKMPFYFYSVFNSIANVELLRLILNPALNFSYVLNPVTNMTLSNSFAPNASKITEQLNFSNPVVMAGNFSWNFTEYNISFFSESTGWTYNISAPSNYSCVVWMSQNHTSKHYEIWVFIDNRSYNITTTSKNILNLTYYSHKLINVSMNLFNISQTYSNWNVTINKAYWDFEVTLNHSIK